MSTGKAKKKNFWKGIPHPVSKFPPPELGRRLFDYLQPRSSPNLVCWMAASVFFGEWDGCSCSSQLSNLLTWVLRSCALPLSFLQPVPAYSQTLFLLLSLPQDSKWLKFSSSIWHAFQLLFISGFLGSPLRWQGNVKVFFSVVQWFPKKDWCFSLWKKKKKKHKFK